MLYTLVTHTTEDNTIKHIQRITEKIVHLYLYSYITITITMALKQNHLDLKLISFRLASGKDYNAIMDINTNIYSKFDYLSGIYSRLSHDPDYHHFVAEAQGQIIAYIAYYCNDKTCKNTFLGMALRVHPSYQEVGVSKKLNKYSTEYIQKITKGKFNVRAIRVMTRQNFQKVIDRDTTITEVMYMNLTTYQIGARYLSENLYKFESKINKSKINSNLSKPEIISVVTSDTSVKFLSSCAPFIMIGLFGFPCKVNKDNLELIAMKENTFITMDEQREVCIAVSTHDIVATIDDEIMLDVCYHGKADQQIWECHVIRHMHVVLKDVGGEKILRIMIQTPEGLSSEVVVDFLRPVFGERFHGSLFDITTAIVYERRYDTDVNKPALGAKL